MHAVRARVRVATRNVHAERGTYAHTDARKMRSSACARSSVRIHRSVAKDARVDQFRCARAQRCNPPPDGTCVCVCVRGRTHVNGTTLSGVLVVSHFYYFVTGTQGGIRNGPFVSTSENEHDDEGRARGRKTRGNRAVDRPAWKITRWR